MMKRFPFFLCVGLMISTAATLRAQQPQELYSHGNPSGEEQYMLELINRARADPPAEGAFLAKVDDSMVKFAIGFYGVDLARVKRAFDGYPVRPPLAFNPQLLAAARGHSADMAKNNFQSHTGSGGSSIASRIAAAGYNGSAFNESIYALHVSSPLLAHVGFNIDWGDGPFGIYPGEGHRSNIMNYGRTVFSEVGIGVVARTGASVQSHGLLAVTQDFGLRSDSPVFLVGVAYDDADGNGICDPGEGIPGIKVMPASGNRYAVTSASGGYAIPFAAGPGNSSVTFSGGGLAAPVTRAFSMTTANVKVDLVTVPALPDVTIAATDAIAGEKGRAGGGAARVRISRTGSTARQLEISISRSVSGKKGKASPSDYRISAVRPAKVSSTGGKGKKFVVTIPAGRAHADLKITAVRDKRKEPVEKLVLTLSSDVAWQAGTPKSAKISIRD